MLVIAVNLIMILDGLLERDLSQQPRICLTGVAANVTAAVLIRQGLVINVFSEPLVNCHTGLLCGCASMPLSCIISEVSTTVLASLLEPGTCSSTSLLSTRDHRICRYRLG